MFQGDGIMNRNRQDSWTEDEDQLLAQTVLDYIRKGKTQLEAFKDVGERLSRTGAACGFRWNATIRKLYEKEIEEAKQQRKNSLQNNEQKGYDKTNINKVDIAISLLEKMKEQIDTDQMLIGEDEDVIAQLKKENERLKRMVKMYHEGWKEMNKVWEWIQKEYYEKFYSNLK